MRELTERQAKRLAGLIVFLITAIVFFLTAEGTGSLWDCGEFTLAAHKLQVVHPPGAPLFIIIGRMFAAVGELLSNDPSDIAYAVNLMSGLCTAFMAVFICWITFLLGKIALVGRAGQTSDVDRIALIFAGVVGGLCSAFANSVWFSAVEGEVYAMSSFFTAMTLWAVVEWYHMPDEHTHDRWLVFAVFSAALSIGVHLLSLLTFPALVLFYYFKKFKNPNVKGAAIAIGISLLSIAFINKVIIAGIPGLWKTMELFAVNSLGLPFHSGLIFALLIVAAAIYFGLRYAHKKQNGYIQQAMLALTFTIIGFSVIGVVVIRANAHPPINMNATIDAMRLLPYINREQYGERSLLYGPHFNAGSPIDYETKDRYGRVGDRYEVVDEKLTPVYKDSDKMLFPRIGHNDSNRKRLYRQMWGISPNPTFFENIGFFMRYQIGWMYFRYFMWNFSGRENGAQGFTPTNIRDGNWITGIQFLDEMRLFNMDKMPDSMRNHKGNNKYYLLPLLFGILGMIFHYKMKRGDFLAILMLFIITGVGISVFSNSPPNEPRERDYIFAGSFITFAIWIGLGVLFLCHLLKEKTKLKGILPAVIAGAIVLSAPILMGSQNYDDLGRQGITASRDYAANFLRALRPNAILFTYGDNDTYPLWYVQEVEGIRTDVRVINLSLIGVDWYINHHRRAMNDSPPVKYTISEASYRGNKRNQLFIDPYQQSRPMSLQNALKFVNESHPLPLDGGNTMESFIPSNNVWIAVDPARARTSGWVEPGETGDVVDRIPVDFGNQNFLMKGELAVLDILTSNMYDRPVYFNTTIISSYIMGFKDYLRMEGMALRLVPFRSTSNPNLGIFGYGGMDHDRTYDAVMNQYEWGNFDKKVLFVDDSYRATQQSHRLSMTRLARELAEKGDLERAAAVAKKYFEAFPHENFPYDISVLPFLTVLADAKDPELNKHLRIAAEEGRQYMEFLNSLDDEDLGPGSGFDEDFRKWRSTIPELLNLARSSGDSELQNEIEGKLGDFARKTLQN